MGLPKSFIPPRSSDKATPRPKYQLKNPELRAQLERYQQENAAHDAPTQYIPDQLIQSRRLLYRGHLGEIITITGPSIHSASGVGVTIVPVERGAWGQLRTIPWHRIVEFDTDPRDPIRNGTF